MRRRRRSQEVRVQRLEADSCFGVHGMEAKSVRVCVCFCGMTIEREGEKERKKKEQNSGCTIFCFIQPNISFVLPQM